MLQTTGTWASMSESHAVYYGAEALDPRSPWGNRGLGIGIRIGIEEQQRLNKSRVLDPGFGPAGTVASVTRGCADGLTTDRQ